MRHDVVFMSASVTTRLQDALLSLVAKGCQRFEFRHLANLTPHAGCIMRICIGLQLTFEQEPRSSNMQLGSAMLSA